MNRRKFIKRGLLTTGIVSIGTATWSFWIEPFWTELEERKMAFNKLPEFWEGRKIMQLSDLHIGNRFDFEYIIRSMKDAKKLEADLVVYTGDFVHYEDAEQIEQLSEVMKHAVKGKLGTFAVLGNHDYGLNWQEAHVANKVTRVLSEHGIRVLRNESEMIEGLTITGIDDVWGTNWDPQHAVQHVNREGSNLILCHNPDACDMDFWTGHEDWILSGHTHGGQVKPPFLPPPVLPVKNRNYTSGEFDLKDGRKLYINRALGHLFQVRFNVRPEITLFELENNA